ncbi:uncharacterized protein LOC117286839 [Fukomys damarensis]|uniref:uncharacterized protein LOC117286839 n=1 Tax=Fukomys damarensis TaxID=885580 RepID=UPI001455B039|nr:uncharacterized protein LOC117286839 [Fukomys damarensis]
MRRGPAGLDPREETQKWPFRGLRGPGDPGGEELRAPRCVQEAAGVLGSRSPAGACSSDRGTQVGQVTLRGPQPSPCFTLPAQQDKRLPGDALRTRGGAEAGVAGPSGLQVAPGVREACGILDASLCDGSTWTKGLGAPWCALSSFLIKRLSTPGSTLRYQEVRFHLRLPSQRSPGKVQGNMGTGLLLGNITRCYSWRLSPQPPR